MYKCQKCGKVTDPGEKLNKLVTSTREKTYVNIVMDAKTGRPLKDKFGNTVEKITKGFETNKEENLCVKCFNIKVPSNQKVEKLSINKQNYNKQYYKTAVLGQFVRPNDNKPTDSKPQEQKYPNSNYQGKNFDPDFYKKKYANQSVKKDN